MDGFVNRDVSRLASKDIWVEKLFVFLHTSSNVVVKQMPKRPEGSAVERPEVRSWRTGERFAVRQRWHRKRARTTREVTFIDVIITERNKGGRGTSLTEIKGRSQKRAGMERVAHYRALSGRPGGRCSSGGSRRRHGVAVGKRSGERQMGNQRKKRGRECLIGLTWELMLGEEGPALYKGSRVDARLPLQCLMHQKQGSTDAAATRCKQWTKCHAWKTSVFCVCRYSATVCVSLI